MSSFGESQEGQRKNLLLEAVDYYFEDGGTIEGFLEVISYVFEYDIMYILKKESDNND